MPEDVSLQALAAGVALFGETELGLREASLQTADQRPNFQPREPRQIPAGGT